MDPATNTWRTVGDNGPEFVDLPKGAIVFNAEQTKRLFAYGRTPDLGQSMASGNAAPSIVDRKRSLDTGTGDRVTATIPTRPRPGKKTTTKKKKSSSSKSSTSLDSLLEKYEELEKELDHLIEHQLILYDIAERGLDYTGMSASLEEQARIYRQRMEEAKKVVDEMIAAGAKDTDEQLQKVEESMWDAQRSLYDTLDKIYALRTDALHQQIDDLQSGYDALTKAADEFAKTGAISVDTFQTLLKGGLQYLDYLKDADGQFSVSEEAIRSLIAAEKEQLSVESALSYLKSISEALDSGDLNKLRQLVSAYENVSMSTWDTVQALFEGISQQMTAAGLGDWAAAIGYNLEMLRKLTDSVVMDTDSALDKVKDSYEEASDYLDHLIEHQEHLYEVAERGLDYDGMSRALSEEVRIYGEQIEKAQAAIEEMIASGADDTDEQLQDMEEALWKAQSSLNDTLDKIYALRTDALNDQIDDLQSAYDRLTDAAKEFAQTGTLSVDTWQELANNGLQFLAYLDKVDGKYEVNREAIEKMVEAEKEQLAIETALSYLGNISEALSKGDSNRINMLVDATQTISDSAWSAVDAQLAALKTAGLTDEQFEKIRENIEKLRDLSGNLVLEIEDVDELLNDQADALDKILELTEDLVKQEVNDQIDALNDQIDRYKEIIDLKKESLQESKDENDYQKDVADKLKEINELQARADKLALDDSRSAQAERMKLLEEIQEKQEDLAEYQEDHSLDAQMDALDDMAEAYEEERQAEIDALEETISSEERVYQLAIERIRTQWETLYEDLIDWNTEQGSILNSEVTDNWERALASAQKYGDYISAMVGLMNEIESSGGDNETLRYRVADLPKYHGGGVVGNQGSINENEVMAILEKGEFVIDNQQKRGLFEIIDFQQKLSERLGTIVNSITEPFRQMMTPSLALAGVPDYAVGTQNQTLNFQPSIEVRIDHSGNFSAADAESFGSRIANSAIEKLYGAFEKKGITGIYGGKLRN